MKRILIIAAAITAICGIRGAVWVVFEAPAVLDAHDRRLITETVHEVLGQLHERGCGPVRFREVAQ